MRERTEPTHIMTIEIPLDLREVDPFQPNLQFDALQDALRMSLSISRAAYVNVICDDPKVTLNEI